jgi:hypothetical protein
LKRLGLFALAQGTLITLFSGLAVGLFSTRLGETGVRAVVTSAGVAFSVQLLTFGVTAMAVSSNVMAGWASGMVIRLFVLVIHGFLGVRILDLPLGASLFSLAGFFFLTSLIEPFFLPSPAPPRVTPTPPPSGGVQPPGSPS